MSLLDYVLGDRAGNYLLLSCLLVAALSIISAIIDIPLAVLDEAGLSRSPSRERTLFDRLIRLFGFVTLLVAFLGTATQAYLASSPHNPEVNAIGLAIATNLAVAGAIAVWGLTPPLSRHWGLCLGAFGLGLAALFLSLATVLRLNFEVTGTLSTEPARAIFAIATGTVLIAVACCMAAIVALVAHITGAALRLAREHRRHQGATSLPGPLPRGGRGRTGALSPTRGERENEALSPPQGDRERAEGG